MNNKLLWEKLHILNREVDSLKRETRINLYSLNNKLLAYNRDKLFEVDNKLKQVKTKLKAYYNEKYPFFTFNW